MFRMEVGRRGSFRRWDEIKMKEWEEEGHIKRWSGYTWKIFQKSSVLGDCNGVN